MIYNLRPHSHAHFEKKAQKAKTYCHNNVKTKLVVPSVHQKRGKYYALLSGERGLIKLFEGPCSSLSISSVIRLHMFLRIIRRDIKHFHVHSISIFIRESFTFNLLCVRKTHVFLANVTRF